jgi:hypothetical protein
MQDFLTTESPQQQNLLINVPVCCTGSRLQQDATKILYVVARSRGMSSYDKLSRSILINIQLTVEGLVQRIVVFKYEENLFINSKVISNNNKNQAKF